LRKAIELSITLGIGPEIVYFLAIKADCTPLIVMNFLCIKGAAKEDREFNNEVHHFDR
jgi:hypothetical protein